MSEFTRCEIGTLMQIRMFLTLCENVVHRNAQQMVVLADGSRLKFEDDVLVLYFREKKRA